MSASQKKLLLLGKFWIATILRMFLMRVAVYVRLMEILVEAGRVLISSVSSGRSSTNNFVSMTGPAAWDNSSAQLGDSVMTHIVSSCTFGAIFGKFGLWQKLHHSHSSCSCQHFQCGNHRFRLTKRRFLLHFQWEKQQKWLHVQTKYEVVTQFPHKNRQKPSHWWKLAVLSRNVSPAQRSPGQQCSGL